MSEPVKPKLASYIDAIINCTNSNSEIARISEMEKYWNYVEENMLDLDSNKKCHYGFWTSNRPKNNTHMVTGENIEKMDFGQFLNPEELQTEMKRNAVASFETLKLEAAINEEHVCVCVLYGLRKVINFQL